MQRRAVQPRAESSFASPARQFLDRPEEHFLGYIQHGLLVPQYLSSHFHHKALVLLDKRFARAMIACLDTRDDAPFHHFVHDRRPLGP
jgi:hypothetical protein